MSTKNVHFSYVKFNLYQVYLNEGFRGSSEVKASACNAGDLGSIPGSGDPPWRRKWQPTPVFLPGESHGRRNLVGYSPRGHKESDTTEHLHFHFLSMQTLCSLLKRNTCYLSPSGWLYRSVRNDCVSHSVISDSLRPHGL